MEVKFFLLQDIDVIHSGESRGGRGPAPPQKCLRCSKIELFSKIYKKMSYDVEFSKFLLNIL